LQKAKEEMLKAGDIVMFRQCAQQGKIGMVSMATKHSQIAKTNPELRLYWVFHNNDVKCFTGSQLVLVG